MRFDFWQQKLNCEKNEERDAGQRMDQQRCGGQENYKPAIEIGESEEDSQKNKDIGERLRSGGNKGRIGNSKEE